MNKTANAANTDYFTEAPCAPLTSLRDERLLIPAADIEKKLLGKKNVKKRSSRFARFLMRMFRRLPVRNRVFFYNVRSEEVLEGNEKALEPWVKGRKVIKSRMLPHKKSYKLQMYYYMATSKVIVCDDYNRYLRIYPLRPSQRVVQLWHACGAFKKFGRYGTPLDKKVDLATHVQYNLVCVSAENIRGIYADAFDIPVSRVHALGCPRTDLFFDEAYIAEKKAHRKKQEGNTLRAHVPGQRPEEAALRVQAAHRF